MMRRSTPIVFVLMFATIADFSHPAFAYLDPGNGSILLQLLFGGTAGVIMLLKLFRGRIADWVHSMRQRTSKNSSTSTKKE